MHSTATPFAGAAYGILAALFAMPVGYFIAALMGILDMVFGHKMSQEGRTAVTTIVSSPLIYNDENKVS